MQRRAYIVLVVLSALATAALTLGPSLNYSTYFGGSGDDEIDAVVVDPAGNVYIAGTTASPDLPVKAALQGSLAGGTDAFVAKLNTSGLVWSTYLGGNGDDHAQGIAVDSAGNVYVAGTTKSTNFPIANAFQPVPGGGTDGFISKLSPTGSALVYSTYVGGSLEDGAMAVAVDATGNAYLTGYTNSSNFPVLSAYQTLLHPTDQSNFTCVPGPCGDAFILKLNAAGSGLVYSTYLGGGASDAGSAIAVNAGGDAFVTGGTWSKTFPATFGVIQPALAGGEDAFVVRISSSGLLLYSTFLGGRESDVARGQDYPTAIIVDSVDNAYVIGATNANTFPVTPGAYQTSNPGNYSAFLSKINGTGTTLLLSTYIGGDLNVYGRGLALDSAGNIVVAGDTNSSKLSVTSTIQPYGGADDAFLMKLNAAGTAQLWGTFLGGSSQEQTSGMALDAAGGAWIAGRTDSSDFPASSPLQKALAGAPDGFLTRIVETSTGTAPAQADVAVTISANHSSVEANGHLDYTITITNNGPDPAADMVVTDPIPAHITVVQAGATQGSCSGSATVTCNLGTLAMGGRATVTITVQHDETIAPVANTVRVSSSTNDPVQANNSATVEIYATSGAGPGSSGCFIATAAYGSAMDAHVITLRRFRDRWLLTNRAGRLFVAWYYRNSPPVAAIIARHPSLRSATRAALWPIVLTGEHPIAGILLVLVFMVYGIMTRRPRGRTRI